MVPCSLALALLQPATLSAAACPNQSRSGSGLLLSGAALAAYYLHSPTRQRVNSLLASAADSVRRAMASAALKLPWLRPVGVVSSQSAGSWRAVAGYVGANQLEVPLQF